MNDEGEPAKKVKEEEPATNEDEVQRVYVDRLDDFIVALEKTVEVAERAATRSARLLRRLEDVLIRLIAFLWVFDHV